MFKFNENLQSVEVSLPAGGVASAPVESILPVFGNTLLGLWLSAGTSGNIYARITDSQRSIVPVTGFLNIPINNVELSLERKLEGPPWRLVIQAYNNGGSPGVLYVIAKYGDLRETDEDIQMLQQLTRIRELLELNFTGKNVKKIGG